MRHRFDPETARRSVRDVRAGPVIGNARYPRKKVPKANLYHQNMVAFRIPEKFDVIFCVFDSINHVLRFSDWKKVFANAGRHLFEEGLFVFDINTARKLARDLFRVAP